MIHRHRYSHFLPQHTMLRSRVHLALCTLLLCLTSVSGFCQTPESLIRKGNRAYKKGDYSKASSRYRQALEKAPMQLKAQFNLGASTYQEGDYMAAAEQWLKLSQHPDGEQKLKRNAMYNAGNALMKAEKLDEAIECYRQALRLDPNDKEAKYNLSEALRKRQEQQSSNQQNQQNQNQQNNRNQKDNQGQNQPGNRNQQDSTDQGEKQQQEGQDEQPQGGNPNEQPPQSQQEKMSEQEAENLLKALENQERKTQENFQQKKAQLTQPRRKKSKDW